jgi:hypothetical protein
MKKLWQHLDQLLRSKETFFTAESLEQLQVQRLIVISILLAAAYGFFMSWYAVFCRAETEWAQIIACMWKVPALFLLTLFICFPSLYVFSTLLGSRLTFSQTLKLLMVIVTITVAVVASFGPIVAFFAICTPQSKMVSYHFMKLLNVAIFAVGGFFGVGALLKGVRLLLQPPTETPSTPAPERPPATSPFEPWRRESDASGDRTKTVFRIWIFIYAMVGAQMGWILRPFLGHPGSPFSWFRKREANFFMDVWQAIQELWK